MLKDPGLIWLLGIANLVFSAIGLFAAASIIGGPLVLGARMLGASFDQSMQWLLYSALLWAPLGSGAGLVAAGALIRGIRRKPPENPKAEQA